MPASKDLFSQFQNALAGLKEAQASHDRETEEIAGCLDLLEGRVRGARGGDRAAEREPAADPGLDADPSQIPGASRDAGDPKWFERLLESSPSYLHIWCEDRSGKLLYANQAAALAKGLPAPLFPDRGGGGPATEPAGVPGQAHLDVVRTGQPSFGQVEILPSSDGSRWMRVNRHPMEDVHGGVAGVIAFGLDITDLREAEAALSASEQRFRTLFETVNEGFLLFEPVAGIAPSPMGILVLEANPALEAVLGLPIPRNRPLDPCELLAPLRECIQRIVNRPEPGLDARVEELSFPDLGASFEVRSFRPAEHQVALLLTDVTERRKTERGMLQLNDELERMVLERTQALKSAIAELEGEIQVRKEVETSLRASEEQFRLVADFTFDWEYWVNPEGRHIYVSPSCERVTGLAPQAFMEDPGLLLRITHPEDRDLFQQHMGFEDPGQASNGIDFRIIRPDGEVRWIGHWCQPVFGGDGAYLGRRASNRDITERKREQRLQAAREAVLEHLMGPMTLEQSLRALVDHVVGVFPNHPSSILLLDPATGCLRLGAATGLPDVYTTAIEGLKIGPGAGCSGAACHTGERVVAENLQTHPDWSSCRELARMAGLGACWSQPILASTGRILGTFAIYASAPESPDGQDLELLRDAASLAGMVIERAQASAELRKLSTAVEASPNGMVVTDLEGIIEYVNPRFMEITGFSREEALGKAPSILKSGLTPVSVYQEMWASVRERRPWRGELCNRKKNGELFWQKLSIAPVPDAGGEVRHLVAITEDITEHRKLQEARARLTTAVEQSAEAMVIMDSRRRVSFANPAFCRILGLAPEEAIGKSFGRRIKASWSEERSKGTFAEMQGRLLEGDSWQGRIMLEGPSESPLLLEGSISPVRNPDGKIDTFVAVFRDFTGEEELERHLRQMEKMDSLGLLAGGIAHDFNNLLMAILTATELIEWQLEPGSPVHSKLKIIHHAANRAQELNRQILTFSRKTEEKRIPFDLSGVLKEVASLLRTALPANIAIDLDIAPSLWVTGDPSQFHQVVMNLAVNAHHAMAQGGKLGLGLSEVEVRDGARHRVPPGLGEGRFAMITVSDSGCGMTARTQTKMFEPFFTTSPEGEGTGLGLSVVHGIVLKHGGSIQVASEPGNGTIIQVFIPCTISPQILYTKTFHEDLTGSEHILFVDDEDIVVALAKEGLQSLGYRVTAKTFETDALEAFQAKPESFDLLITDLAMPNLSGTELTRRLRKIRPDLPAILVTGVFQVPAVLPSLAVNFDEVLAKPLPMDELARAVRRVMAGRAPAPAPAMAPPMDGAAGTGLQPMILLVEDSSVTRSLLRTWLAKGGYRVREARDGQEAWEIFCAAAGPAEFSLVLTDLDMPRMNGLELVQKIRGKDPEIPVLVLTASEDMDSLREAMHLHVDEFLIKPFASKGLLDHVKRLAAKRRSGAEAQHHAETAQAVRLAQRAMEAVGEQDLPVCSICEPLTEAGGDVFRCLARPDGSVVLVLADVAGHSVASSYAVAAFLGMLSTFVQDWRGLPDLFQRLNQFIQKGPFPDIPIAVLAAHWDPRTGRLHVVNAGNPCGVWSRKTLARTEPIILRGTPLGLFEKPLIHEKVVVLEEGDRVVFGTDGLFDAPVQGQGFFRDQVPFHWGRTAELPLALALGALCEAARIQSPGQLADDVLVVGLEQPAWSPGPGELLRVFPSEAASVEAAGQALARLLGDHPVWRDLEAPVRFNLFLGLHEALANAIEHGNGGDARKRVTLWCRLTDDEALVRVVDEGPGFDLEAHQPPAAIDSERSRGVPILRAATRSLRMRGGELEFHLDLKGAAHEPRS